MLAAKETISLLLLLLPLGKKVCKLNEQHLYMAATSDKHARVFIALCFG